MEKFMNVLQLVHVAILNILVLTMTIYAPISYKGFHPAMILLFIMALLCIVMLKEAVKEYKQNK
jgi:hypothetical protein